MRVWLVGAVLFAGCFRPVPCVRDSECGGPGGVCDVTRSFCVTTVEMDAGAEVDAGAVDAGPVDAGPVDAGPVDAGPVDAGAVDAGAVDAGTVDAGAVDAGAVDAGVAPRVSDVIPLADSKNVPLEQPVSATFTEPMDPATITPLSFTLMQGATNIDGGVTLNDAGTTATFTPAAPLATSRLYTATITLDARSAAGLPLAMNHTWSFTTALVALRSAQTYSVLGASVTNTGLTVLSGDLGVSTAAPIMGGATIVVGGATQAGTAPAIQARSDLQVAYAAAAALSSTSTLATLDGRRLTPGIYTSAAALALNTTLTLDAEGDPNAVFIFQIDAALGTAATTSSVMLAGGAQTSNIFWQVSGAVTLGAASSFKGTIIGLAAITVGAATRIDGRALSIDGNVTLANNNISN